MTCESCPIDKELTWPVCNWCGGGKHHDATGVLEPKLDALAEAYRILVTSPGWWKIPFNPTFEKFCENVGWIKPETLPVKRCCLG